MAYQEISTGLDLGSSKVRVVTIQKINDNNWQVVGVSETDSQGISKGLITDIESAVSSISECLEKAERMIGMPIERAAVGISGAHIKTLESKGVVAVAKADGEIKEEDVGRALEAAQTVATPPNYEILHVIPRNFTVDNQTNIKDPLGMTGVRLEVNTQIIMGLTSQIKGLTKCIYRTGVDISELIFSILATAESTLTKKQKEIGVALLNIGQATTSLVVFEEDDILHTAILPVGSGHITADIAIGLRTSLPTAEAVKLEFGQATADDVNKRDEFDLSKIDPAEKERSYVSLKHVAEIIQARVEEIFSLANQELKKINRNGMLPAGVILTGGGAKLPGIIELAKNEFKLPAFLGKPLDLETAIDKVDDPSYTTALGLALWARQQTKYSGLHLPFSSIENTVGKIKNWFKSLMP